MSHTIVNPDGLHNPIPFGYSHTAAIPAGTDLCSSRGSTERTRTYVVHPDFDKLGIVGRAVQAGRGDTPPPANRNWSRRPGDARHLFEVEACAARAA